MKNNWKKRGNAADMNAFASRELNVKDARKEIARWEGKSDSGDYSLVGMMRASVLIKMYKGRPITVVGDYDVDGKCAAAILGRVLKRLGYSVTVRNPRRISEGYGINEAIVDEIESNDSLLITVDNGITAFDAINKARARGIDVIITDHHLPAADENGEAQIPEAEVVIDPNAIENSADFKGYCGAGIAYKLACYLLDQAEDGDETFRNSLLTLAAVATIADCVPMREENHVFVRKGLELLSKGETFPGMRALLWELYLAGRVTEEDVAFKIAPCINADTRLEDRASAALDLLFCDDEIKAKELARDLKTLNETRKELCSIGEALADKVILGYGMTDDFPLVVNVGDKVKEGLIGILAGRLAEKYRVPAFVFAETEGGILKGSGRSAGDINLHAAVSASCSGLLETFGGHAAACGLSVKKENFIEMKTRMRSFFAENEVRPAAAGESFYDFEITEPEITGVLEEMKKYSPYGEGFPSPVFKVASFLVTPSNGEWFATLAKDGVKFTGPTDTVAVGFGFGEAMEGEKPKTVDLYGSVCENYFKGKVTPQVVFTDMEITSRYSVKA